MTSWYLWGLVILMKWILGVIRPPVELMRRNINYLLVRRTERDCLHYILTWGAPQNEYSCSTPRWSSSQPQKVRSQISAVLTTDYKAMQQRKKTFQCVLLQTVTCKQTWKFSFIRTGLKLFGMTTTPLCTLNLRATWAEVFLYFLASDTSSSSSSSGGHVRFTLLKCDIYHLLTFSTDKCIFIYLFQCHEKLPHAN